MQDRFKFRAIVKGYYYIDTSDKCEEFNPSIFLENIDVLDIGDIGISEEDLEIAIRKQYPDLQDIYVERIMENFRDNSNGVDTYITITPELIYQCTGLKDKNGKLIYEKDIIRFYFDNDEIIAVVEWDNNECRFYLNTTDYFKDKYVTDYEIVKQEYEVIGNIYENPKLIKE